MRKYRRSTGYKTKKRFRKKFTRKRALTLRNQISSIKGNDTFRHYRSEVSSKRFTLPWNFTNVFPENLKCKMVYKAAETTQSTGAGSWVDIVFRGNNIYDPYYPVGGRTVMGWPEANSIYKQYKVIGSRITVYAWNLTGATARCYIWPSMDFNAAATETATMGENNVSHGYVLPGGFSGVRNAGNPGEFKHSATTSQIMNAKGAIGDPGFSALMAAAPAHEWYWHVAFASGTANNDIKYSMEICYYVVLFDLKHMTYGGV